MEGIRLDEELLLKSSSTERYCGFESYAFRHFNSVVEESGLSRSVWDREHVGSNPTYATINNHKKREIMESDKSDKYRKQKRSRSSVG